MKEIAITTMSSKGQIVIPSEMRKGFHDKEKFVIIKHKKQLILKRVEDFDENIADDLEFARRTEEAWEKYDRGEYTASSVEEFLEEMKKW